jgi:serine/threonine protein kinase
MIPLVSAVAALHDLGFVHRDLKPSNVILAERRKGISEPVLIDLGIVKAPRCPQKPRGVSKLIPLAINERQRITISQDAVSPR